MTLSIALTTLPSQAAAQALAHTLLEARLAACVSILPLVHSMYWWNDKIEESNETLLMIKFAPQVLDRLESCLMAAHPYEVPEFLVLSSSASQAYLQWAYAACGLNTQTLDQDAKP